MGAQLDIDDVCHGHPLAMQELAELMRRVMEIEMTFEEWWDEYGSGLVNGDLDSEEHAHKVARSAWALALSDVSKTANTATTGL